MEGTLFRLHLSTEEIESRMAHVLGSPKDNGTLELIVRRPSVDMRDVLDSAILDTRSGLIGDNWSARGSSRTADGGPHPEMQLNIMNWRFACLIAGGPERVPMAGDQLFVDLDLSRENLPPGTRISTGSAVVEITAVPHLGCKKFVERFGIDAMKFANSEFGRSHNLRGVNAKVITSGTVAAGDNIAVIRSA